MYDYSSICKALGALCDYHIEEGSKLYTIEQICDNIKRELNKEFKDVTCTRVVYTPNTDKSMFGIHICPDFGAMANTIRNLFAGLYDNGRSDCDLDSFEPFKMIRYQLEIDGRILASNVLSPMQLWALIFNEISIYNSTQPIYNVRAMIDTYIAKKEKSVNLDLVYRSSETFNMVLDITLHNLCSAFAKYGEDISIPAQITNEYGLGLSYKEAINILKENVEWHQPVADTTGLMMVWYFNHYDWIRENRTLEYIYRDAIMSEASKTIRQLIKNALEQNVMVIDVDKMYYTKSIQESTKRRGLMWQMKRNGIKSIEEDLFEYTMRIRNIETEDDAIILMRQINSRMSILEDYLREEDIDDVDRKRWEECYSQYVTLRSELSKKTLYKRKQMGLWMDYNYLADDSGTPQSQAYY